MEDSALGLKKKNGTIQKHNYKSKENNVLFTSLFFRDPKWLAQIPEHYLWQNKNENELRTLQESSLKNFSFFIGLYL